MRPLGGLAAVWSLSMVCVAPLVAQPATGPAALPDGYWSFARATELLAATETIRLDPDRSMLTPAERAALVDLFEVGVLMERLYERARHPQALAAHERLMDLHAALGRPESTQVLLDLYGLFRGPIATTLDNRREPFLPVSPGSPARNVYPAGLTQQDIEQFMTREPTQRARLLDGRSVVRRATAANLAADIATLQRFSLVRELRPGELERLQQVTVRPDALYSVDYAIAYAAELTQAFLALTRAADKLSIDDPEFARYLRNRARDLVSNDYESGDASWVTGKFRHLNAQIGAYETYDDALLGVKAFHGMSILVRDERATVELRHGLRRLQELENALPYSPHKQVKEDIPVGVYDVVADFGEARSDNTATILPNDASLAQRYGRTILLRGNIIKNPTLFARRQLAWQAATKPEHAGELAIEGHLQRTQQQIHVVVGPQREADVELLVADDGQHQHRQDAHQQRQARPFAARHRRLRYLDRVRAAWRLGWQPGAGDEVHAQADQHADAGRTEAPVEALLLAQRAAHQRRADDGDLHGQQEDLERARIALVARRVQRADLRRDVALEAAHAQQQAGDRQQEAGLEGHQEVPQRHQARADHHGLRAAQHAVGQQAAEQRREVDQARVQAGDEGAELQGRARAEHGFDRDAHRADAHHVADVLGQEQVLGEVQPQQDLHAVVGETLPQFAEREPAEAGGVPEEGGVGARIRLGQGGSDRRHDGATSGKRDGGLWFRAAAAARRKARSRRRTADRRARKGPARRGRATSMRLDQPDLEQLGPELARHEQALAGRVVGDAVEHVGVVGDEVLLRQQALQVDPADDLARLRVDACDAIRLPEVGVDLAFHPLELVDLVDRLAECGDVDAVGLDQRLRVEEADVGGAVAHHHLRVVVRQAPALAGVAELPGGVEAVEVEHVAPGGSSTSGPSGGRRRPRCPRRTGRPAASRAARPGPSRA